MNDTQRLRLVTAVRDHLANVGCDFVDPRRLQDNLYYSSDEEVSQLLKQAFEHIPGCERGEPLEIELLIVEKYDEFAAGLPIGPARR